MADAVASQTILDGPRNVVMKFTNVSDGTGEAAVTKVDVSALTGAPGRVAIKRIEYSTQGMAVRLLWDATTDDLIIDLPQSVTDVLEFEAGGLQNPKSSGYTGDIQFTTVGHTSGDTYSVVLHMIKKA